MLKGALLMCKRRPFATQKMPFYKPTCNQLRICWLQSGKSTVFFCFALHHGFKFVIFFYYSSWVMFCMRIRRSIHYEYCAFILRSYMDCMGTYHALRFEYHVSYVRILCGFRYDFAWIVSKFVMRYIMNRVCCRLVLWINFFGIRYGRQSFSGGLHGEAKAFILLLNNILQN